MYNRAMETNMKTVFRVRIRHDGGITLPKELRDRGHFEQGTRLTIHDLGNGVMVVSRARSRLSRIADRLANEWSAAGASLESMLETLHQVRNKKRASR